MVKEVRSTPSRLLKNNSPSTATCVTKKPARNGRAAESGIQLLIAGGTGAEGSSAARRPGHGGRGAGAVVGGWPVLSLNGNRGGAPPLSLFVRPGSKGPWPPKPGQSCQ